MASLKITRRGLALMQVTKRDEKVCPLVGITPNFEDRQVMVDDVVAEHEACALPQAVQFIEDAGQVLVDLAFEFVARVGAQGTDHEDAVGLVGFG